MKKILDRVPMGPLVAIAILTVLASIVIPAFIEANKKAQVILFEELFEVKMPTHQLTAWDREFLQLTVTEKLTSLAIDYRNCDSDYLSLLYADLPNTAGGKQERAMQLKKLQSKTDVALNRFERSRDAAKNLGFEAKYRPQSYYPIILK